MTLPDAGPASSRIGKEEYSAMKDVPSFRHRSSLSSRTGRPLVSVWSSGQAEAGYTVPSGRV